MFDLPLRFKPARPLKAKLDPTDAAETRTDGDHSNRVASHQLTASPGLIIFKTDAFLRLFMNSMQICG